MKNIRYKILVSFSSLLSLLSCGDKYDFLGEYDIASYYDGLDPRVCSVSVINENEEFSTKQIGDYLYQQEKTKTIDIKIKLSQALKEDSEVTLKYNADADKLQHKPYSLCALGEEDLIQFENEGICLISAGDIETTAKVTIDLSKVLKETVIPLGIYNTDKRIGRLDRKNTCYIVVKPLQVWNNTSNISRVSLGRSTSGTGFEYISGSENLSMTLKKEGEAFDANWTVKLVRDDSFYEEYKNDNPDVKLAPEGIFEFTSPVTLNTKNTVELTTILKNAASFTEPGKYVLPLVTVFYDESNNEHKKQGVNDVQFVEIEVKNMRIMLERANMKEEITMGLSASAIAKGDNWEFTTSNLSFMGESAINNIFDGLEDTSGEILINKTKTGELIINFSDEKAIKGISLDIHSDWFLPVRNYMIFISKDGNEWMQISDKIKVDGRSISLKVRSGENISTQYLKIFIERSASRIRFIDIIFYN